MANTQNKYKAGQYNPGFGTNMGIYLPDELNNAADNLLPAANLPTNGITSAAIAKDIIQYVEVPITAAEIIAMKVTPKVLIAAPGSGLTIVLHKFLLRFTNGSTQFTGGGNTTVNYTTGSVAATAAIANTIIQAAAASKTVRNGIDVSAVVNSSLELTNASADFAAGDGTAVACLWYAISPAS